MTAVLAFGAQVAVIVGCARAGLDVIPSICFGLAVFLAIAAIVTGHEHD